MQRVVIPELFDGDSGTEAEIANAVSDLRRINRWFGGNSTTLSLLRRVSKQTGLSRLTLLEVAAGGGDVPEMARRKMQSQGVTLEVTLLDRARSHLRSAASQTGVAPRAIVGDALALPFPDSSFDVVASSLFAHHLDPGQLVEAVDEGLRVARMAVLINDLARHPVHLGLVYAGLPLFSSRLTRHDAPASVRRAYTGKELRAILLRSRAQRIEIESRYLFRLGVTAWKQ